MAIRLQQTGIDGVVQGVEGEKKLTVHRIGKNAFTLVSSAPLGNVAEVVVLSRNLKEMLNLSDIQIQMLSDRCKVHADCDTFRIQVPPPG